MYFYLLIFTLCVDITVSFTQSTYNVDEDDRSAKPELVLSDTVDCCSTISIYVKVKDATAKGKRLCTLHYECTYLYGNYIWSSVTLA